MNRKALALGAVVAVSSAALIAFVTRRDPPPHTPTLLAMPIADASSESSFATLPSASDAGMRALTCDETLVEIRKRLTIDDKTLTDKDHDELVYLPRIATRDPDAGADANCGARIAELLTPLASCGRAANALAVGLFGGATVSASVVRDVLKAAQPGCRAVFAESAGFASDPGPDLLDELEREANALADDRPAYEAAWLAFGSLGETAARLGRKELQASVERRVIKALRTSSASDRLLMLRVAGNAACAPCASHFISSLKDNSAEIRRAGTSGLRFITTGAAVARMCERLENDNDLTVRDLAAWSLQWRKNDDEARATCLVKAAMNDPTKSVRIQATQSLGLLAHESNLSRAALIHLTGPEAPPEVRRLATQHVMSEGDRMLNIDEQDLGKYFKKQGAAGE